MEGPSAAGRRSATCGQVGEHLRLTAVYLLAIALFFRSWILSGFDLGFGERGDAIIEIAILEHWRNVLVGASAWNTSFYFHPHVGTLGYNDGYLLYGLIYSAWRTAFDPFHADTLVILTLKTIGFFAAYRLVAHGLGWGRDAGRLVALLWTIASGLWLPAVHAQLQSVALLPLALMLAIGVVRAERDGRYRGARARAVALAALMAAWLLTVYYMAWFTIFSAGLFGASWCAMTGRWRPAQVAALLHRHAATIACGVGAFAVVVVPFLTVYLPTSRETGGHPYDETIGYLVTPIVDMVNVGVGNYLWGWLFRPLLALVQAVLPADPALPRRVLGGEHETGVPPILCGLLVVAAWRILVQRRTLGGAADDELRAFTLATIAGWLLTLQFWWASPGVRCSRSCRGRRRSASCRDTSYGCCCPSC